MSYRIGVDIGGTFADFCALDEATGRLATLKVLSTPQEPGREVIAGLAELGSRFGIQPQGIGYFTHGTTVGINSAELLTPAFGAMLLGAYALVAVTTGAVLMQRRDIA